MKTHHFISILLCLSISCSGKEELKKHEEIEIQVPNILVESDMNLISKEQNGDVYFNGIPFSGYLIFRNRNDSVSLKKGYVDGKLNGITRAYYENGAIGYIRPYLNGEKHGLHKGFYSNGEKKFQYYFEYGFSEGNHLEWYESGQKSADMNYVKGKEFGKQQAWRPDGKLRSNYIVRENGRVYGLQGIKRCTKLDGATQEIDPYKGNGG